MSDKKRFLYGLVTLLALAALLLAACGGGGSPSASQGQTPIKIGAVFDLSGSTADVGTPYAEGIKGYVEWKNSTGGINGHPIDLHSADYAYKVDQAEQLYNQYVQDGVVAFQGWGTGDTEALRTKVAADKIPFMSASYSAALTDMSVAPFNFLIGTTYSDQALIALRWALDDWKQAGNSGAPKVAIIHHDSPFGQSPVADAKAFAEANGMPFTELAMPKGATDYVAELAQLQQFGANYVVIHTTGAPASVLLKDAQSQGLKDKMKFIGLNWAADENFIKLAGPAAEGVYGAIPFTPPSYAVDGHKDADAWLKQHGSSLAAKGLHYTQGWWTMAVMAEAIKRVLDGGKPVTGENIKAALEGMQGIETGGVTSTLNFSPTSHKGNAALRLYVVKDGKWQQLTDLITAAGK